MKRVLILTILTIFFLASYAQKNLVKFEIITPMGNMKGVLYNDTPGHRDNFIKLVNEGWYEDSPFHRIINHFMIQGGGNKDGRQDPGYIIPAEFVPEKHIHKKGALAAARMGDNENPTKASSGSQFYIVQGKPVTDAQLIQMETSINRAKEHKIISEYITRPENIAMYNTIDSLQRNRDMEELNKYVEIVKADMKANGEEIVGFHYSDKQKAVYRTLGGTPHLDGGYTVFGEITEGFDVIDKIAAVPTARGGKPLEKLNMKIIILEN